MKLWIDNLPEYVTNWLIETFPDLVRFTFVSLIDKPVVPIQEVKEPVAKRFYCKEIQ